MVKRRSIFLVLVSKHHLYKFTEKSQCFKKNIFFSFWSYAQKTLRGGGEDRDTPVLIGLKPVHTMQFISYDSFILLCKRDDS